MITNKNLKQFSENEFITTFMGIVILEEIQCFEISRKVSMRKTQNQVYSGNYDDFSFLFVCFVVIFINKQLLAPVPEEYKTKFKKNILLESVFSICFLPSVFS